MDTYESGDLRWLDACLLLYSRFTFICWNNFRNICTLYLFPFSVSSGALFWDTVLYPFMTCHVSSGKQRMGVLKNSALTRNLQGFAGIPMTGQLDAQTKQLLGRSFPYQFCLHLSLSYSGQRMQSQRRGHRRLYVSPKPHLRSDLRGVYIDDEIYTSLPGRDQYSLGKRKTREN